MQPNIVSGQAIGTVVSATSSTDLASINTQGLAIGTKAWNVAVGAYFTLTLSTASLVTDSVVAVSGLTGARWIVDTAVTAPVTNAVLATMAARTYKANLTGGTAVPGDSTSAAVAADLGLTASTTVTLAVAGTNIDFTGLAGNTDGDYMVTFDLIAGASGTGNVSVKVNDLATNQNSDAWYAVRGVSAGNTTDATLKLDSNVATGHITGRFFLTSKTGKYRFYDATVYDPALSLLWDGIWTDTTTSITKVSIVAATAAGLAIGSTATLQKLFRTG